jgi:hypothetical protein
VRNAWERGGKYKVLVGQPERDHSEDRGINGRMGSGWILGRLSGGGMDSTGSG